MESSKDKGSRASSKVNLNESNIPLLEDDLERQKIELKEVASTSSKDEDEKDDSKTEKQEGELIQQEEEGEGNANDTKDKKKKKKKEALSHRRNPSCVNTFSVGLNLLERDEKHNNDDVNIQFEDIICEPDSSHSFDGVWRLTYIIFSTTKLWCYRLLAALVALPCAIFCGFNFALLTCFHVWGVTPAMRIFQINIRFLQRFWSLFFRAIFDPIFQSIGMLCSNINIRQTQQVV
ncbi:hypothetical protein CHUAL_006649 [Chamberlinius hualienensis]